MEIKNDGFSWNTWKKEKVFGKVIFDSECKKYKNQEQFEISWPLEPPGTFYTLKILNGTISFQKSLNRFVVLCGTCLWYMLVVCGTCFT